MSRRCARTNCEGGGLIHVRKGVYLCPQHAEEARAFGEAATLAMDTELPDPTAPSPSEGIVLSCDTRGGIRLDRLFPGISAENIREWQRQSTEEEYRRGRELEEMYQLYLDEMRRKR